MIFVTGTGVMRWGAIYEPNPSASMVRPQANARGNSRVGAHCVYVSFWKPVAVVSVPTLVKESLVCSLFHVDHDLHPGPKALTQNVSRNR